MPGKCSAGIPLETRTVDKEETNISDYPMVIEFDSARLPFRTNIDVHGQQIIALRHQLQHRLLDSGRADIHRLSRGGR